MTQVQVRFGLFDVTARQDAVYRCEDCQGFVDLTAFNRAEEVGEAVQYGTGEEDFFLLDGSFSPFPDTPAVQEGWGLWSAAMSGPDGHFSTPPVLDLTFSEPHSSMGLTLTFAAETGDFAAEVDALWYDGAGNRLSKAVWHPTSAVAPLEHKVENYQRVVLTFPSTLRPFRYLKLARIDFGLERVLGPEEVVSATLLEELDPTSAELSINTLRLRVHSQAADFSLLNPKGMFSLFQQRQQLVVEEWVEGELLPLGTYYLDSWEDGEENSVDLAAIDWVGLLDKTTYAGCMVNQVSAGELVGELCTSAGAPYQLDERLAAMPLSGHLSVCSYREALQQVAFALGAVVDCSRSDCLHIFPSPDRPTSYIRAGRKFAGGRVGLRAQVTGVEVVAHRFLPDGPVQELLSDTLPAGVAHLSFDQPIHSLSLSGGTLLASGVHGAEIWMETAGSVVLTGQEYVDSKQVISQAAVQRSANIAPNLLRVEDATLVSPDNAKAVAKRLLDYHQQRMELEFQLLVGTERVGDKVMVDSLRGERVKGIIESMELDLTGGFIATMRVVGTRIPTLSGIPLGEQRVGEEMGPM